MTNIRDSFEKWYEKDGKFDDHAGADKLEFGLLAYQAAHKSAETTLTAQALVITRLEDRCKELEDALREITRICYINKQDSRDISQIYMKSKQVLSTKLPTEKEVR